MPELLPSINHKFPLHRLLVLVAHPDDEAVGCGTLLQRAENVTLVFATDGAPNDQRFWSSYESHAEYARARRAEAATVAELAGAKQTQFLDIPDQELFRNLSKAHAEISAIAKKYKPDAIVTHAYEGGHPDHDACSFLAWLVGQEHSVPVWEMPLYHRAAGDRTWQQFIRHGGEDEVALTPTPPELQGKRAMIEAYASQGNVLKNFDVTREVFRPQAAYDFTKPPHEGRLNYEEWRWPMTGGEVSRSFSAMLSNERAPATVRSR